jgi:hypothetical protein
MSDLVLYSTNTFLKFHIQNKYRSEIHYVWCSECFDRNAEDPRGTASLLAPSSNPADIYRDLKRDVSGTDSHSAKITAQKITLSSLALEWAANGDITVEQKEDILYMVEKGPFNLWRPLLYVIPRAPVGPRLQRVPYRRCAGFGNEYIIPDLKRCEFGNRSAPIKS